MTAQIFTSSAPEITPYAAVISPTGLPSPVLGDDPNVPRDMLALATALDNVTVPVFATTAARDAARTAGALFNMCFVAGVPYRWRGTVWVQLADYTDLNLYVLKTDVHTATVYPAATAAGVTLPAGGGTLGIAGPLAVAAAAWPRVVQVTLAVTLQSATTFVDYAIRGNGVALKFFRGITPQLTVTNTFTELVPAGTARSYDATVTSTAAAVVYSSGANLTWLTAVAFTSV